MRSQIRAHSRWSVSLLLVGYWLVVPTLANAYTFSRDLKLGDAGEDVRALQVILNTNSQTRVAVVGPGSPGYETGFFGEKTLSAVIRYQNLHTNEVLKPLGLVVGTGYVGTATRRNLSGINTSPDETTVNSSDDLKSAVAAFDVALGTSQAETNRSPVDDPRIPKTQTELIEAVESFAGDDPSDEDIKEFGKQMVLARYGYQTDLKMSQDDDDDTDGQSECSDGINNDPSEDRLIDYPEDKGCTNSQDNTELGNPSGHSSPSSQDADIDGTGAGCIGLLLGFLGF